MKKLALLCFAILVSTPLFAWVGEPQIDTLVMMDGVSVSVIKQGLNLNGQSGSASILSKDEIEKRGVSAIKNVSESIPNLHIPDYGSRTTSSIYIRGLGARIDQPVMGLNIDNVPYLNKNAFDTEVMDIERVEVLRGPQSTLYGRNTMGGVMNIYTLSPFNFQGLRLGAEYSSGNTYKLRTGLYSLHSEKLASAFSLYYNSTDGFFVNSYTGENCDWEKSLGARAKFVYRASSNLRVENTTSFSMVEQGGYPYRLIDSFEVNYNTPSSYDRTAASNGTTIKYQGEGYTLASITSYQYLDDDMMLDNDFTAEDYFTLQQAIKEHSATQDIVYRTERDAPYNFLLGAFGFFKHQKMNAPVVFKSYGIEDLILSNANYYFDPYYFAWDSEEFALNSRFTNNTLGAALYHESTYQSDRWKLSAGLRVDYERSSLNYSNYTSTSCTLYNGAGEIYFVKPIEIDNNDKVSLDFFEILPKFDALYQIGAYNQSSLYFSVSKGYKAGGFNTQIFSDILQQQVMKEFGITLGQTYDSDEVICYDPEHSWNYEVGSHLKSRNGATKADIALFYIDCRNQQLTVFPEGQTTGRMMTNAGRSRSYGAEVSFNTQLTDRLAFNSSYGYTNAKFLEYTSGDNDYKGNYVPYAPQHTFYGCMSYTVPLRGGDMESIGFEVGGNGAGRIYWNEDNSRSQPLYALVQAAIRFHHPKYNLSLWGKNLTNKSYNTFYFQSMEREFVQSGKPLTIGATININI